MKNKYKIWNNENTKFEDNSNFFIDCFTGEIWCKNREKPYPYNFPSCTKEGKYVAFQSLGKKDKYGNLIYKGDLLKDSNGDLIFTEGITFEDIVIAEERCSTNFEKVSVVGNILENNITIKNK